MNYTELALRLLIFAPAFTANSAPLIARNIFKKTHPVDFGRSFLDRKRLFGDSKSWEGFVAGILVGTMTGAVLAPFYGYRCAELAFIGLLEGLSAMIGDLMNSFLKRRLGLKPGAPLPVFDQLSFILTTIAIIQSLDIVKTLGIELGVTEALAVVIAALILHPISNYVAYLLKLKEVPY